MLSIKLSVIPSLRYSVSVLLPPNGKMATERIGPRTAKNQYRDTASTTVNTAAAAHSRGRTPSRVGGWCGVIAATPARMLSRPARTSPARWYRWFDSLARQRVITAASPAGTAADKGGGSSRRMAEVSPYAEAAWNGLPPPLLS